MTLNDGFWTMENDCYMIAFTVRDGDQHYLQVSVATLIGVLNGTPTYRLCPDHPLPTLPPDAVFQAAYWTY